MFLQPQYELNTLIARLYVSEFHSLICALVDSAPLQTLAQDSAMDHGAETGAPKHSETELHKLVVNLKGFVTPIAVMLMCQPPPAQ
jgi:hypothetical protein